MEWSISKSHSNRRSILISSFFTTRRIILFPFYPEIIYIKCLSGKQIIYNHKINIKFVVARARVRLGSTVLTHLAWTELVPIWQTCGAVGVGLCVREKSLNTKPLRFQAKIVSREEKIYTDEKLRMENPRRRVNAIVSMALHWFGLERGLKWEKYCSYKYTVGNVDTDWKLFLIFIYCGNTCRILILFYFMLSAVRLGMEREFTFKSMKWSFPAIE